MVAVEQVPGRRGCHSSQKATDRGKGQRLGSRAARDKIPVEFGEAGMSLRGDRAVLASGAELRLESSAVSGTPKHSSPLPTLPQAFSRNPLFFSPMKLYSRAVLWAGARWLCPTGSSALPPPQRVH